MSIKEWNTAERPKHEQNGQSLHFDLTLFIVQHYFHFCTTPWR